MSEPNLQATTAVAADYLRMYLEAEGNAAERERVAEAMVQVAFDPSGLGPVDFIGSLYSLSTKLVLMLADERGATDRATEIEMGKEILRELSVEFS